MIGGKPNRTHAADWLAGFIPAHWIHYENSGRIGTAWFCPVTLRGVLNEDKHGRTPYESVKLIRKDLLSEYGFLCDIEKGEIGWRFRLKDVLNIEDMNKKRGEYEKHIPRFRKAVYPPFAEDEDWSNYEKRLHLWFVFSKLEKLKEPLSYINFKVYKNQYDKTKRSPSGIDFRNNVAFAVESPKIVEEDIDEDYKIENGIDEYLKRFFITKPPDKPMRESIIQDVFITKLLEKDFTPRKEVQIERGRIDVLFEKEGRLIAVEIKRDFDDNSVDQLKGYIEKCKKEFKNRKIDGWIICGRKSKTLKENAKGYRIIEYKVSLDFSDVL